MDTNLTHGAGAKFDLFDRAKAEFECDQDDVKREITIQEALETPDQEWGISEHRAYLLRRRSKEAMNYPLIQRRLVVNPAFLALSGAAVKLLLLCHEATYWERPPKQKRGQRYSSGKPGSFQMPYRKVQAADIGSSHNFIRGLFNELVGFKFLAIEKAEKGKPTTYKLALGYRNISETKALEIKQGLKSKRYSKNSGAVFH